METIKLIHQEVDDIALNQLESHGKTPLHIGFARDNLTIEMLKILEGKIEFATLDILQRNFLHSYIIHSKHPNKEMIHYLIERGVTLGGMDKFGRSCFHYLFMREKYEEIDTMIEIIDLLLNKLKESKITHLINTPDSQQKTVLHYLWESNIERKLEIFNKIFDTEPSTKEILHASFHLACLNPTITLEEIKFLVDLDVGSMMPVGVEQKNILHLYCENKNIKKEIISFLVDKKADPCTLDNNNRNLFHLICSNNSSIDVLELLFSYGLDFNLKDSESECSPIHICCLNKNFAFVEQFLLKKVDVNSVGPFSKTPLVLSCEKETDYNLVNFLLEKGATDIDFALQISCQKEEPNLDVIKLLCKKGANINITNFYGRTLLHFACSVVYSNQELVEYLYNIGVDVNKYDKNKRKCIFYSCQLSTNPHTVKFLLEKIENVKEDDVFGQSLLHAICMNDKAHVDTFKMILEKDFEVNRQESNHKTPLHFLCENKNIDKETVALLLENKANPNTLNCHGRSPLHDILLKPVINFEVLKLLVTYKANINTREKLSGKTALHLLISLTPKYQHILYLLENKADPNIQDLNGSTSLSQFVGFENFEKEMTLLLSYGADPNKTSFLHYFVQTFNLKMIETFLIHNADPNKKNNNGKTAKQLAIDSQFKKAQQMFEEIDKSGTLWSAEKNKLFPIKFRQRIFAFVLSCKVYFSHQKKHLKLPKPLLFSIIQLISVPNHSLVVGSFDDNVNTFGSSSSSKTKNDSDENIRSLKVRNNNNNNSVFRVKDKVFTSDLDNDPFNNNEEKPSPLFSFDNVPHKKSPKKNSFKKKISSNNNNNKNKNNNNTNSNNNNTIFLVQSIKVLILTASFLQTILILDLVTIII
eukprot:TRINITY_DN1001_c0_g3_i1.p1 TRINITY_DN1001_c0_g3~~TRINITY_DN1001_c0_g3_i1.p1  ORF type:complete len:886 (-),score=233.86 TRINITY_DN1001_c0_g3_i1:11-2626(-)